MKPNYAVVRLNSRQYIVSEGSKIKVDRVSPDTKLEILMAQVDGNLTIGEPTVADFGVKLEVIEEKKDAKLEVRRYKSKSKYRKHKGHRQPISILDVVGMGKDVKNEIAWNIREPKSDEEKAQIKEAKAEDKEVEAEIVETEDKKTVKKVKNTK